MILLLFLRHVDLWGYLHAGVDTRLQLVVESMGGEVGAVLNRFPSGHELDMAVDKVD